MDVCNFILLAVCIECFIGEKRQDSIRDRMFKTQEDSDFSLSVQLLHRHHLGQVISPVQEVTVLYHISGFQRFLSRPEGRHRVAS